MTARWIDRQAAAEIIARLGLVPHPEGGHYRETFRHVAPDGGRGAMTAIFFLLARGELSDWHRIDAAEIWHWYAGAPLLLTTSPPGWPGTDTRRLGPELIDGSLPQLVVPAGHWQMAESEGDWTLAGCTVGPAFEFAGFELASKNRRPAPR